MERLTLFQVVEVTPELARGLSAYVVAIDGPQVALGREEELSRVW